MIYWQLFWGFLQVGCLAFGGAYAAIPFIRDIVLYYGWLDENAVANIIAISESTPGPVMINMATYVGQTQGGFLGALIATSAVVIPSFLVTIIIMGLLRGFIRSRWVRACLRGLIPCIAGIISLTGLVMLIKALKLPMSASGDCSQLVTAALLLAAEGGWYIYRKQIISPILLLVIAGLLGIITGL